MIDHADGSLRIVRALSDTPASRPGVMPGDILVAINGQPVIAPPWKPVLDQLRGPIGPHVSLTVGRGVPVTPVTFDVERSVVSPRPIVADVAPGTPTVVLVNDKTAAGGEIIVAALRQGRHAVLLRIHTTGLGLVATEVGLGELGSMRLAPSGSFSHQVGGLKPVA